MDWTDTLKSVAPTVATALLGPLGGAAVTAIGSIFGVDGATTDKIKKIITDGQMTPEQVSQLKALEMQYQDNEKERGFKYAELATDNTKDARQMQSTVRSWIPGALAIGVTVGFFGILAAMLYGVKVNDNNALLILLGSLGTSWGAVINFYFGSSQSSQAKDATIFNLKRG